MASRLGGTCLFSANYPTGSGADANHQSGGGNRAAISDQSPALLARIAELGVQLAAAIQQSTTTTQQNQYAENTDDYWAGLLDCFGGSKRSHPGSSS